MAVIRRTPIATPLWVKIVVALAVAILLTMIAALMTGGGFDPVGGKQAFYGAMLAIPLVVAAKFEWGAGAAIALAFATYFLVSFFVVLFFMREKHLTQSK